jgi:hypothetical protein
MKVVVVNLPDELAAFVERAVADGSFDSPDHLFAHAVGLVHTEAMLGFSGSTQPTEPFVQSPPPPVVTATAVDLTRQAFDSPAFMADLVGKIKKRADDAK